MMENEMENVTGGRRIVDALKDPILLGAIGMAAASHNPTVGQIITQAPETVSTVIAFVTLILKLFKKRR